VKEHAQQTRYQSIDFEYHTARKDYEDCILHASEQELLSTSNVISKLVGIHQSRTSVADQFDKLQKMRSGVSFTIDCNNASVFLGKGKCPIPWCSKFFNRNKVKEFLNEYQLSSEALGQTQFNMVVKGEIVKIHGDPTINHHDWVVVGYDGKRYLCHVVFFVYVLKSHVQVIFKLVNWMYLDYMQFVIL